MMTISHDFAHPESGKGLLDAALSLRDSSKTAPAPSIIAHCRITGCDL
jgi:hypothetical protein